MLERLDQVRDLIYVLVVPLLTEKLIQTVYHNFPIPKFIPPPVDAQSENAPYSSNQDPPKAAASLTLDSQDETALPSSPPQPPEPPRPSESALETVANGHEKQDPLLPHLKAKYTWIKHVLNTQFATQPPHTIQRLSELVLDPRRNYTSLSSYLNALDRVLSVASSNDAFPMPAMEAGTGRGALVNGNSSTLQSHNPASDDSLGGALLTPISWLREHGSTSPAHRGSIDGQTETSSATTASQDTLMEDGPVTQGQLLRREQETSAPPAPVASLSNGLVMTPVHGLLDSKMEGDAAVGGEDEEQPHARGPETIGPEDTGPQDHMLGVGQALNMEAAVGRLPQQVGGSEEAQANQEIENDSVEKSESKSGGDSDQPPKNGREAREDNDGDIMITDVDGLTEQDQKKHDASGDNTTPDAVDMTSI